MEPTATIRSTIEDYIRKQGYTLQYFADISGVNAGTLSAIIKGTRPIAMAQLDLLTEGMKLEEGHFYEQYGAECFVEAAPHWRRLEPFLQRCAELDKLDCIQNVIRQVTDDRSYISELFEMAEGMFERGQNQAALMLYECVAECEKYQHSERLALCQYRIFTLSLGQDQHANLRAAVHFEPFINRLDEERQLDAIKDLANTYGGLNLWDKVLHLANELEERVNFMETIYRKNSDVSMNRLSKYPLFIYKYYSYLMKSVVFGEYQDYETALSFTKLYSDIHVENASSEDRLFIERFKGWAEVNTYLFLLMMGNLEALKPYVNYIENNPDELLPGLVKILEASNMYDINIDHVLTKFDSFISLLNGPGHLNSIYNTEISNERQVKLLMELAKYYLKSSDSIEGFVQLLSCLSHAIRINDHKTIIYCVGLFEKNRSSAPNHIINSYRQLIEEVYKGYEKKKNIYVH